MRPMIHASDFSALPIDAAPDKRRGRSERLGSEAIIGLFMRRSGVRA